MWTVSKENCKSYTQGCWSLHDSSGRARTPGRPYLVRVEFSLFSRYVTLRQCTPVMPAIVYVYKMWLGPYFRLSKTAKMTRKCHNLFVVACLATFCAAANAGDCGLFKFDDGKYVEPFSAPSKVLVWVWSHWHFDSHKAVFVVASHNEVGICVRCVFLCRAVNPYTLLIELL